MVAGDGDAARAGAEAFEIAQAVESCTAIGRGGLGKDGSCDVAVCKWEEGDRERAASAGSERGAGWFG